MQLVIIEKKKFIFEANYNSSIITNMTNETSVYRSKVITKNVVKFILVGRGCGIHRITHDKHVK